MLGFIIVDKPAGISSHDVVRRIRKLCGVRRVGHAGTLDPMATGILPVAIGDATRLIEYFSDREKGYRATLHLGSETDTQDSEGAVLQTTDWHGIDQAAVEAVMRQFLGAIEQVPPMYSALKKDGVPLYRLARQGVEIERPARPVTIHSLDLVRFAPPEVTFDVVCSKGTYVRTLCHDIGRSLGCLAHMTALRRFRHGGFDLQMADPLEELEQQGPEQLAEHLLSPLAALADLPRLQLDDAAVARLLNGVPPVCTPEVAEVDGFAAGDLVCLVYDQQLRAVARYEPERQIETRGDFRLQKVFHPRP